jgi:hypothetical protein
LRLKASTHEHHLRIARRRIKYGQQESRAAPAPWHWVFWLQSHDRRRRKRASQHATEQSSPCGVLNRLWIILEHPSAAHVLALVSLNSTSPQVCGGWPSSPLVLCSRQVTSRARDGCPRYMPPPITLHPSPSFPSSPPAHQQSDAHLAAVTGHS